MYQEHFLKLRSVYIFYMHSFLFGYIGKQSLVFSVSGQIRLGAYLNNPWNVFAELVWLSYLNHDHTGHSECKSCFTIFLNVWSFIFGKYAKMWNVLMPCGFAVTLHNLWPWFFVYTLKKCWVVSIHGGVKNANPPVDLN